MGPELDVLTALENLSRAVNLDYGWYRLVNPSSQTLLPRSQESTWSFVAYETLILQQVRWVNWFYMYV